MCFPTMYIRNFATLQNFNFQCYNCATSQVYNFHFWKLHVRAFASSELCSLQFCKCAFCYVVFLQFCSCSQLRSSDVMQWCMFEKIQVGKFAISILYTASSQLWYCSAVQFSGLQVVNFAIGPFDGCAIQHFSIY